MPEHFTHQSRIDAPCDAVFAWHTRPGALERLTPPWQEVRVLERTGTVRDGDRVRIRLRKWGLPIDWLVEHRDYVQDRQFRDLQLKGPFAYWQHTHRFEPDGEGGCLYTDEIEYEPPLGALGSAVGGAYTRHELERMFAYRHRVLAADLAAHRRYAPPPGPPLIVAVTGSHGLIGSSLVHLLTTGGHVVRRIVRHEATADDQIAWDPARGTIDADRLRGVDAVVHLAGESLMGRWTDDRKRRIRESRDEATRGLCEALARMEGGPRVLVSASAIGYYGDRGDEVLTEASAAGEGFLPEVCVAWERATDAAAGAGIRVVNLRIGVVLTPAGGALRLMLPPFRAGLGGQLGDGTAWMSWITLEDLTDAVYRAITDGALRGPVNAVAPEPVTNGAFSQTLAAVLNRPALIPAPKPILRAVLGEMADEAVLASARVKPAVLEGAGFAFRHRELETALRQILGR